jgi:hypothetical protein
MTITTTEKPGAPQVAINDIGTAEDFLAAIDAPPLDGRSFGFDSHAIRGSQAIRERWTLRIRAFGFWSDQASFDCAVCGERSGNRLTRNGSHSLPDLSFGAGLSTPVGPSVCQRRCFHRKVGEKLENQSHHPVAGNSEANGVGVRGLRPCGQVQNWFRANG